MDLKISASIAWADLSRLGEEIKALEKGGIDYLHFDVMDGHFVPNFSLGPRIMEVLRNRTKLVFDAHLMVTEPGKFVEMFAKAGANILTFHKEAHDDPFIVINRAKKYNLKVCVALKPSTDLFQIENLLPLVDMVFLLCIEPGISGQKFQPEILPKIDRLRGIIHTKGIKVDIEAGGGINQDTVKQVIVAGANVVEFGKSTIFNGREPIEITVRNLKALCIEEYEKSRQKWGR